jgi:hypothetical protein
MATLVSFSQVGVGEIKRQLEATVQDTMRTVAGNFLDKVVRATPVDTGRARSNWQVGIGDLSLQSLEPFSPGVGLGLAETANAEATIEAGNAVLKDYQDGKIIVGNAVRNPKDGVMYIEALNSNSSQQAPSNFVELSIIATIAEMG